MIARISAATALAASMIIATSASFAQPAAPLVRLGGVVFKINKIVYDSRVDDWSDRKGPERATFGGFADQTAAHGWVIASIKVPVGTNQGEWEVVGHIPRNWTGGACRFEEAAIRDLARHHKLKITSFSMKDCRRTTMGPLASEGQLTFAKPITKK